jgi:hypothetical protein
MDVQARGNGDAMSDADPTNPGPPPVVVNLAPSAAPPVAVEPPAPLSPAVRTLEGLLSFVVSVAGLLPSTLGTAFPALNTPVAVQVTGLIVSVCSGIALALSRTALKQTHVSETARSARASAACGSGVPS